MKRFLPVLVFMLLGLKVVSNPFPVEPPVFSPISLSEFMFESNGDWVMELIVTGDYHGYGKLKTIEISTSTDKVVLQNSEGYERGYLIIKSGDLDIPLNINTKGDSITISAKLEDEDDRYLKEPDILIFGDYPKATVGVPKEGHSLTRIYPYGEGARFSKNSKPTIGYENDEFGMRTTLEGRVFLDKDEDYVYNYEFHFRKGDYYPNIFSFKNVKNGDPYSIHVWSTVLDTKWMTKVYYDPVVGGSGTHYYNQEIEPVYIDLEPGEISNLDIYFVGAPRSIENDQQSTNPFIKFYPNPVKDDMKLAYEINLPINTMNVEIEVVSMSGTVLDRQKVTESTGMIDLPRTGQKMYIVNCKLNNKVQYSEQVLLP